jgi:long-subunit fatty acid transport protein
MRRFALGVAIGVVAGSVSWSDTAFGQTQRPLMNFNLYGGGTRANALGGAFIGLSDDGSAATWNPAGLTQNDRIYTEMDWGFAHQQVTNSLESPTDLPILYDNTTSQSIAHFYFLSFNGPLTLKGQRFHLAATWNRASFVNYEAEYTQSDFTGLPIDLAPGIELQSVGHYTNVQGGPEYATLAMATQLKEEKLSVGFGLNIFLGNERDSLQTTQNFTDFTIPRQVVIQNVDRRDYSGVNFNFGALFQASQFTVGVTARTPFNLELTHDARDANTVYEVTTDSLLLITEFSVLSDYKTRIGMPLQLGLGLTYRPQENLVLSGDYEYKGFSQSKTFYQADALDPKSDFVEYDPEWKDVHQFRMGVEYQIGLGWGVIPLRAGFRTEPQPYSNQVDVQEPLVDLSGTGTTANQGDQVVGSVYTLGSGVQWRQIRFDVTWEMGSTTDYGSGYFNDSFLSPQFIYTGENRTQRLLLGFTGYF